MVEEAVVLVVRDEQRRLAPQVLVRREDLQHLRRVPGAVVGRPVRMLAERLRRHDPRHLRQRARGHVGLQEVEEGLRGIRGHIGADTRALVQRRARQRVLVLVEVQQRVVAVVADVGVAGPAPVAVGGQAGAHVLVDLPADARGLQLLWEGRPTVARLGVVDDRAAARSVVADPARPHVVPVRIGGTQQRAVVRVAQRERVGQRVVERDVLAREVGHRVGALGRHPLVVAAAVPGLVRRRPVVRRAVQELQAQVGRVRMERQQLAAVVRLVPDRLAVGQRRGTRIAEAAHALHAAEVVVEGTVLLHQDHDVLDVLQRARVAPRGNRQGLLDEAGHGVGAGRAGHGREAEEVAPVRIRRHGCS